ncbi:uncharacterized protein CTRU02_209044 [Colletotrichum truncatum]|uniref:Uncharacterized protein n=1 Tax=Colletotrichum truncatum TaxID=5467 RepID=A0ACC3YXY2_COLTU|nr:uncharacterized protein CTRU02_07765 [Colletotrichum truncatum]KAF6790859.1 hypothetical protein CTRU02_07765 [Colletotrichum truncatum]
MASLFTRARLVTLSKFVAGTAVAVPAGFHLWTRQCAFEESFSPATDPIFQHPILKKVNPKNNPDFHDCCFRTVPFDKIRPDLLEDALNGGSKLVEAYSAGVWGRYAFTIQRKLMEKARKIESNAGDIWDKEGLLKSTYPIVDLLNILGTIFADDFVVVDKSPNTIMLRGGLSPRVAPDGPREMDTFITLTTELDPQTRVAKFKLKSMVLDGVSDGKGVPLGGFEIFLHQQYAKFLVTAGVDHCVA